MLSDVDQPRQPGMRIDLEHPDARLEPQPFSQRAHGSHQYIGWHTLAMQQWAVRLLEITRLQAVAMVSHRDVRRREDCLVPSRPAVIGTPLIGTALLLRVRSCDGCTSY